MIQRRYCTLWEERRREGEKGRRKERRKRDEGRRLMVGRENVNRGGEQKDGEEQESRGVRGM